MYRLSINIQIYIYIYIFSTSTYIYIYMYIYTHTHIYIYTRCPGSRFLDHTSLQERFSCDTCVALITLLSTRKAEKEGAVSGVQPPAAHTATCFSWLRVFFPRSLNIARYTSHKDKEARVSKLCAVSDASATWRECS